MASCFHYSAETVRPILLEDNKYFKAYMLYWNIRGNVNNLCGVDVVLRIRNKHKEYISLFASNISVNGIPIKELASKEDDDSLDKRQLCYYLGSGEENEENFSLYWVAQKINNIKQVSEISFSLIAQNDDKDIARTDTFTVIQNIESGDFILQK
jgi:hypothetical protein